MLTLLYVFEYKSKRLAHANRFTINKFLAKTYFIAELCPYHILLIS